MRYYIWGTGISTKIFIENNKELLGFVSIEGFIDNDKQKQGQLFEGKKVYSPQILEEDRDAYIYIATNVYRYEIERQINEFYPWYSERIDDYVIARINLIRRYRDSESEEIQEIIEYLQNRKISPFNYSFVDEYINRDVEVNYDSEAGLFFVSHNGKRMYFSKKYDTKESVRKYYVSVILEQDEKSPHRYLSDSVQINDGDVVVDAGVAEGNFSLDIIDKVSKIYLIEMDQDWCEALRWTFAPYKDKVVLIDKCISDFSDNMAVTLDGCIKEKIDCVKLDVEGEELCALMGAERHINNDKDLKILVCTYHQEHAFSAIKSYLEAKGLKTESSYGYIWYFAQYCNERPPVLRRGIIRAKK